jgi:biotin carboxyl carrier protein
MPGLVKQVLVEQGSAVKIGSRLLVLEAMKMENDIIASKDGTVTEVLVRAGEIVDGGKPLVVIE